MQNQEEYLLVQTSCPDNDSAIALGQRIIQEKVAACVNVLPEVTSIYEWKGEVKQDSEVLLLIKTEKSRYIDLQAVICASHPYELPEVIAVPISEGLPEFLSWIKNTTTKV
ncbi:MAG: divalent-cation tolerance protein CutA [Gammaproteobacteria bacterium]|nr:divalent-cation tolerance protein CutA [Gammaproteobacteria bacterium]